MARCEVDGWVVRYERAGAAHGPVVLLLCTYGETADAWHEFAAAIGSEFGLLTVDLPAEPAPVERHDGVQIGFAGQAGVVAALLDELKIDRCHVVGHGLGGVVAQALALRHPERINALVLVGTSPERLPNEARAGLAASLAAVGGPRTAANQAAAALLGFEGVVERLESIVAPALIVVGETDAAFIQRGAELLHGWIPFSRFARIPGSGHQPQRDNPATFNADVLAFLREVQATSLQ